MNPEELASNADHHRAIGRIVESAARLDSALANLLWALLGPEQRVGQIVTGRLGVSQRLQLLGVLVAHLTDAEDVRVQCAAVRDESETAMAKRDRVVHATWGVGVVDARKLMMNAIVRAKSGIRHDVQRVSAADLSAIAEEFEAAHLRLDILGHRLIPHMFGVVSITASSDGSVTVDRPTPKRPEG